MRWLEHSSRLSLAVVGLLLLLLVVLASLQYRWIAQLSEAERARLQEGLDQAATSFCGDFDREMARAFSIFALEPIAEDELPRLLAERLADWRSRATWPELVQELYVVRLQESAEETLLRYDEQSRSLVEYGWNDDLRPIHRILNDPMPGSRILSSSLPGFVLPIQEHDSRPHEWRPPRNHLIVRFDLAFIAETLFPQLAETHFSFGGDQPYLLSVSSSFRPQDVIFRSETRTPSRTHPPDATATLFGLRQAGDLPRPPRNDLRGPGGPPHPGRNREHRASVGAQDPPPPGRRARSEEGLWLLAVRHPEGSLESVVAGARQRNMMISLVMVAMLGITTGLMLLSTRNARRLARQQMDFVASVSHELRTPLTAIRSAGQNLADGIIDDPDRVRSYGLLIEREGRRLTGMIGRVLTFAGIRSGHQINRMKPVSVADVINASLKDCSWVLEEKGFKVHTNIADDLPPVQADAAALQQVVTNLIDNALKYAAAGRWLGIEAVAEPTSGTGELQVSVSDHGPGITKKDQTKIFEAFWRSADAAGSSIPGSGLGLAVVRSIVEAHGGTIEAGSPPDGGTRFTVRLPVATANQISRGTQ